MRLISYRQGTRQSYGAVTDAGVVDLGARLAHADLRAMLAAGAVEAARAAAEGQTADIALEQITFMPVIPNPDKIICIGLNYKSHQQETGQSDTPYPTLFTRFANSQVGHGQPLIKPKASDEFDYEGELAVVIGKGGRHIAEKDAMAHVAGYSCYHDASVRDWQFHTSQFVPGKNFPSTGGFGPWLVTADEIPDPSALTLTTRLNGDVLQEAPTDQLIFTIPVLIAYISTFTRLEPGDVIPTGTPGGVGARREPPIYMKPGDVAEIEISDIGILRNPVIGE